MRAHWFIKNTGLTLNRLAVIAASFLIVNTATAQSLWVEAADTDEIRAQVSESHALPRHFRAVVLELKALEAKLSGFSQKAKNSQQTLMLPHPMALKENSSSGLPVCSLPHFGEVPSDRNI